MSLSVMAGNFSHFSVAFYYWQLLVAFYLLKIYSNQPVLKNENCKLKLKYLQFPHNIDIKQKMIFFLMVVTKR